MKPQDESKEEEKKEEEKKEDQKEEDNKEEEKKDDNVNEDQISPLVKKSESSGALEGLKKPSLSRSRMVKSSDNTFFKKSEINYRPFRN